MEMIIILLGQPRRVSGGIHCELLMPTLTLQSRSNSIVWALTLSWLRIPAVAYLQQSHVQECMSYLPVLIIRRNSITLIGYYRKLLIYPRYDESWSKG